MTVALDTSVVVAALLADHEAHARALRAVQNLFGSEDEAIVPYPVVVEAYAVMTRLPPPLRVEPADAEKLLRTTFERRARVVQTEATKAWGFVGDLVRSNVRGGTAYDAQIIACAIDADAGEILTFNERHFRRVAPRTIHVRAPS